MLAHARVLRCRLAEEAYPRAKAVALRALEMDETLAEAHDTLATVLQNFLWDWESAGKEYKRAIDQPQLPHRSSSLCNAPRPNGTVRGSNSGGDGRPKTRSDVRSYECRASIRSRKRGTVRLVYRTIAHHDRYRPAFTFTYVSLAMAYERKGMFREAIVTNEKGLALGGSTAFHQSAIGHGYGSSGDHVRAREILLELQQKSEHGYIPFWSQAIVYHGLGENELAIGLLQQALKRREAMLVSLKVWPLLQIAASILVFKNQGRVAISAVGPRSFWVVDSSGRPRGFKS